jgi:hypothetical protein
LATEQYSQAVNRFLKKRDQQKIAPRAVLIATIVVFIGLSHWYETSFELQWRREIDPDASYSWLVLLIGALVGLLIGLPGMWTLESRLKNNLFVVQGHVLNLAFRGLNWIVVGHGTQDKNVLQIAVGDFTFEFHIPTGEVWSLIDGKAHSDGVSAYLATRDTFHCN